LKSDARESLNGTIFPTRLRAEFLHSAWRTVSLAFFNFPMVLNKLFRQQKIPEFFNSKFNSSLTDWCQTEFLILKISAIVIFWKKKTVISVPNNRRVIFFFNSQEKMLNVSHGYLIWCILMRIIPFFYGKRFPLLKVVL